MTRIGSRPRPALAADRGRRRGGPDLRQPPVQPHGRGPDRTAANRAAPGRCSAMKVSSASAPWTLSTEWPRCTRSSRVGWPRCWSPRTKRSHRERSCCAWKTGSPAAGWPRRRRPCCWPDLQLRQARKQPELHRMRVAQQQAMRDATDSRVAAARRVLAREEKLAKSAVITDSDRSVSEEKIRELEALERAEAERLGRAGGPGCRGRDPSRGVRAEGGRGPARTGETRPGGMPREGPRGPAPSSASSSDRATCWEASRVSRPCCSPPTARR